ncbi:hypothetical protein CYMTET_52313 [Cymbomonas tetramitiformis]|uniref:Sialidase domain-containing protein n=1 Tax=Cymbomonas tetramitiformis TaxID=36881 RepID=A0AAE0ESV8_9CHLO|nr:hypothetical protein CYMTET_52313 [Cymbomonas tetramitiformis]
MSRLPRGARQWSAAVIIAEESASSCQNPVLFYDPATELLTLLHTAQQAGKGQGTSSVRMLTAAYGPELHWSRPLPLAFGPGAFIRNHLLRGETERWLLPMYYTPNGTRDKAEQYASVARTNDGSQWSEVQLSKPGSGLVQPSIVRISSGPAGGTGAGKTPLVAFFRDRDRRAVSRAFSYDDGRSWTEPEATQLPNNNKAIQAHFSNSTGSLLIVFNNAKGPKIRGEDLKNWPISIAISKDAGVTWPYVRDLEPDFDPMLEYSYPSIQQGENGELHISYTWSSKDKRRVCIRYIRITEDWIERSWPKGSTQGEFKGDGVRWGNVKQRFNRIIDQAMKIMNDTKGQAMIDNAFVYHGKISSARG